MEIRQKVRQRPASEIQKKAPTVDNWQKGQSEDRKTLEDDRLQKTRKKKET